MRVCGIIAEYNPFHNGHKYQIEQSRAAGATHIAVAMSGSFMQRGEPAIFDKWTRAAAAVDNGADLVLELPAAYSLSSASRFAFGGVSLLNALKIDMLGFGSECGDIAVLREAAAAVRSVSADIRGARGGVSYPRALSEEIAARYGDKLAEIISEPNNLLAVEYINAVEQLNPNISPFTVLREGARHDGKEVSDKFASAKELRRLITEASADKIARFVPESAFVRYNSAIERREAPIDERKLETAILYKLRSMSAADFAALPDVSEGLENRLFRAAKSSRTLEEFYFSAKTKRYTLARIRRAVYSALIGITERLSALPPRYLRVLAMNKKGFELLGRVSDDIPHSPKFADLYKAASEIDEAASEIDADISASDILSLGAPFPSECGLDFTKSVIIV